MVSFATIMFELLQTRILSFIFWNHMVYLTVSVALLGFGISGTLVAIFSARINQEETLISKLLCGFGCSAIFAFGATVFLPLFGFQDSLFKTIYCYVIYLAPFVFSGAILSLIFSRKEQQIARLYAADLVSAAFACVLFFFLLPILEPARLIGITAVMVGILAWAWLSPAEKKSRLFAVATLATGALLTAFSANPGLALYPEDYKELFEYLNHKGVTVEKTIWTPLCRLDIAADTDGTKIITQDGTAHTQLHSAKSIAEMWAAIKEHRDDTGGSVVFETKKNPDVAVIGVGGGYDVVTALGYGAKSILAAELNPFTYELITKTYADFNGHVFDDARVKILNEEGRSLLRQQNKRFDIIQVHGIDTFAALSSGAYVLGENYLYTVQSFKDLFAHLQPDGILSFLRWNSIPPKESLRLVALGCEAWAEQGCNTMSKQIFVLALGQNWAVTLFKNTPFTLEEINVIARGAQQRKLQILYWPAIELSGDQKLPANCSIPPSMREDARPFWELIHAYAKGTEKEFFDRYPFLIRPTTDDSPFFFEYYAKNPFSLPNFAELRGNAARATLYIVMLEATIFTALAIILPLWRFSKSGLSTPVANSWSVYFAAIGAGFMLIEIALMQKSVLFLGSALYALPIILASILLSAGLGSWLVSKVAVRTRKMVMISGLLLVVNIVLIALFLTPFYYALFNLPLFARMIVTSLVIFPTGLLMGTFMPTGLESVKEIHAEYIPWAWGINGCSSVYGSFLAIILAISFGFTSSLMIGAVLYSIAVVAALSFTRVGTKLPSS